MLHGGKRNTRNQQISVANLSQVCEQAQPIKLICRWQGVLNEIAPKLMREALKTCNFALGQCALSQHGIIFRALA